LASFDTGPHGANVFQGTTISITGLLTPEPGLKNRFFSINVGEIDAQGINLGSVTVSGDLGQILAGVVTNDPQTVAVGSLTLGSFGVYGSATGAASFVSVVTGSLGSLTVKGDMTGVFLDVTGNIAAGSNEKITIDGSLIGGALQNTGSIQSGGNMGPVTVLQDVVAGSGAYTGFIKSGGTTGTVGIDGFLGAGAPPAYQQGNVGNFSGFIESAGNITGAVTVANMFGGSGVLSGSVLSGGALADVHVTGSVIGGAGNGSGAIVSMNNMGSVTIGKSGAGGNVMGGTGDQSGLITAGQAFDTAGNDFQPTKVAASIASIHLYGNLQGSTGTESGTIASNLDGTIGTAGGNAPTITIDGNVIGASASAGSILGGTLGNIVIGNALSGGSGAFSGEIYATKGIGNVTVGSISGGKDSVESGGIDSGGDLGMVTVTQGTYGGGANISQSDYYPVLIEAAGINPAHQSVMGDRAIAGVTISGGALFTDIKAGYTLGNPVNPNAGIGPIVVIGSWTEGSIVAGVENTGGVTDSYGNSDDVAIALPPGKTAFKSTIASIDITGQVTGAAVLGTDGYNFGFVAQDIGSFAADGMTYLLPPAGTPKGVQFNSAEVNPDVNIDIVAFI